MSAAFTSLKLAIMNHLPILLFLLFTQIIIIPTCRTPTLTSPKFTKEQPSANRLATL